MWIAFWINFLFLLVEIAGSLYTNSLALLSDAGHMLTDVGALGIAIWVSHLGDKPRDNRRSYGYMRAEIIGAFVNGAMLVVICGYILLEAWNRVGASYEILGVPMLIIAVLGLLANVGSAWVLAGAGKENLNIQGAYLHLVMDALGSVGAIISGIAILFWQLYVFDIIASIFIVLLILAGTYNLIRRSIHMLMDGVPDNLDYDEVEAAIMSIEHVLEIHDLHIWSISQGHPALSAHLKVSKDCSGTDHWSECLKATQTMLNKKFNIEHSTLQIEPLDFVEQRHCG